MIKNNSQLQIARKRRGEYDESLLGAQSRLEEDVVRSIISELDDDIAEFDHARGTAEIYFDDIGRLGQTAIRVRLARGLTQAQLAERLGVAEQVIQRFEAHDYDRTSLDRIGEVFDALGFVVSGRATALNSDHPPTLGTSNGPSNSREAFVRFVNLIQPAIPRGSSISTTNSLSTATSKE